MTNVAFKFNDNVIIKHFPFGQFKSRHSYKF